MRSELKCALYGTLHGGKGTDVLALAQGQGSCQDLDIDLDEMSVGPSSYIPWALPQRPRAP